MSKQRFKLTISCYLMLGVSLTLIQAKVEGAEEWTTVYKENFDQQLEGTIPKDFFVLDGEFQVVSKEGRKCLSLSANPVGEHGLLFGPRLRGETVRLSFSCLGAFKSRRHNVFAGALGGMRGLGFRINPSSQKISFSLNEEPLSLQNINWSSTQWMRIHLEASTNPSSKKTSFRYRITDELELTSSCEGSFALDKLLSSGRCVLWGFSYSGKEMYWDDLLIRFRN
jgi:hypothetical protein